MHRPVVIVEAWCGVEDIDGFGVNLVFCDKFFPDRNIKCRRVDLAAHDGSDRCIMCTGVGDAFEVFFRINFGLQQEAAWHQVP